MCFFNNILLFSNQNLIIDIVISIVLLVIITLGYFIFSRKIILSSIIGTLLCLSILLFMLDIPIAGFIFLAIFIIITLTGLLSNIGDVKLFSFKSQFRNRKTQSVYDKSELYQIINTTVHSLSRSKTGALMTFERRTNLDDLIKNGTEVNAPISQELLETIFYEGTRLHDGAVVIRGDTIIAASVYYTPTTRALTGKYGSRHRAAFGISEITDAVTVVVSEETGRVSIACNGNLSPVSLDNFLREFTDIMNSDSK